MITEESYLESRRALIEALLIRGTEIVEEDTGQGFVCEKVVMHEGQCRIVLKPEAPGT